MAAAFNKDIGLDGKPNMSDEMIEDFKNWSRALGGEGDMEGVESDLKKYIKLGFCRNTFIYDMENSAMLDEGLYEEPEYTPEEWEKAKIEEVKEWKIQAKQSDYFYSETQRLREERDELKRMLKEIELKQLLDIN